MSQRRPAVVRQRARLRVGVEDSDRCRVVDIDTAAAGIVILGEPSFGWISLSRTVSVPLHRNVQSAAHLTTKTLRTDRHALTAQRSVSTV